MNKKQKIKITLLVFLSVLYSCHDSRYEVTEYNKDGFIVEGFYFNGKLNGAFKEFYENGTLYRLMNYVNDTLHGKQLEYHRNGTLKAIANIKNGKKNFSQYGFWENGILQRIEYYINGKYQGWACEFHANGALSNYYFRGYRARILYKDSLDTSGGIVVAHSSNEIIDRLTLTEKSTIKVGEPCRNTLMVANPPYAHLNLKQYEVLPNKRLDPFTRLANSNMGKQGEFAFERTFYTPGDKSIMAVAQLTYKDGKILKDTFTFTIQVGNR